MFTWLLVFPVIAFVLLRFWRSIRPNPEAIEAMVVAITVLLVTGYVAVETFDTPELRIGYAVIVALIGYYLPETLGILRDSAAHHTRKIRAWFVRWSLPAIGLVALIYYATIAPDAAAALTIELAAFIALAYGIWRIFTAPLGKKKP